MRPTRRTTVHLDADLLHALRQRAEERGVSVSKLVNEAVRDGLREIADDLEVIAEREGEPVRPFGAFVAELQERGEL